LKVLIALDHSSAAQHAARTAVALLAAPDLDLLVINVTEVPLVWAGAGAGFGAVVAMDLDRLATENERCEEEAVARDAIAAGIPASEVEVRSGDVVHEICEAAERHDVDLIVVGSHDRSILSRVIEPSVSRGVISATNRPVLVVPEPHDLPSTPTHASMSAGSR
jgi:nucleotide-binding universal stress UspA family protein